MNGIGGLVCVGLLILLGGMGIRRFRRSSALHRYGRPVTDEYTSIVVADTTYEELSSLGLGMCLLRAMILLDSRLVHYWCIEVAGERVSVLRATLRFHEVRILAVGCSGEEAVTCCLQDTAVQERRCAGCGGVRESRDVQMCAACVTFLTEMEAWAQDDWGNEEHDGGSVSEGNIGEKGDEKPVAPCVSCGRLTTGVCVECGRPVCWCWLSEGTPEEIAGWWCGCQESGEEEKR